MLGRDDYGQTTRVALAPPGTRAVNFAFDVTPARLVSGPRHRARRSRAIAHWLPAMFPGARRRPCVTRCDLREAVIATALAMNALGINRGKSGNVSARIDDGGF